MKPTFCIPSVLTACCLISTLAAAAARSQTAAQDAALAGTDCFGRGGGSDLYGQPPQRIDLGFSRPIDLHVIAEVPVSGHLSDLAVMHAGKTLVAVDETAHRLLVLEPKPEGVSVQKRIPVDKTPVSIAVDAEGTRCAVASLVVPPGDVV